MAIIEFITENIKIEEFFDNIVLEVGSKCVNGSVRPIIEKFCHPKKYIGVDLEPGKFVDVVVPAEKLVEHFGPESFDVIISTELLEHVKDWRYVISNMKKVLKPQGYVYLTTRSKGYPYHGYPNDFWRYELDDITKIFKDFNIFALEKDQEAPGVLLKAAKPKVYVPIDLSDIALYSVYMGKRTKDITYNYVSDRMLMSKLWSHKFMLLIKGIRK